MALLEELEAGRVDVHFVESAEPSPLAHGILTGRPFTFLDGAPLEERRTRAVPCRVGSGPSGADGLPPGLPVAAGELGPLDPVATAEVLDQVRPRAPGTPTSSTTCCCRWCCAGRCRHWRQWFDELAADGRAGVVGGGWAPTERRAWPERCTRSLTDPMVDDDEALAECVGGHLDVAGPVTVDAAGGGGPAAHRIGARGSR